MDIACPGCEYNLRGLLGPVVECPECGLVIDVPDLAARQWDRPWYRAPGLLMLSIPGVTSPIAFLWLAWLLFAPSDARHDASTYIILAFSLACQLVWLLFVYKAYVRFRGGLGIGLVLLMHLIVCGYYISILGFIIGCLIFAVSLFESTNWFSFQQLQIIIYTTIAGLLFAASRLGERYVARICIRNHMKYPPLRD